MSSQPNPTLGFPAGSVAPRINLKTCPACDQEIPPDKLEEIGGRIAARQREQVLAITAQLDKQYAADKARAENKARADLEAERQQSAIREVRAREEADKAAAKSLSERLAQAEERRVVEAAGLREELAAVQAAKKVSDEMSTKQQAELKELRETNAQKIAAMEAHAKRREAEVAELATKNAEAAAASRIAQAEKARSESEAAKAAAEQVGSTLSAQLEQLRHSKELEIAKLREDGAAEILRVRHTATQEVEARFRESLVQSESAVAEANARAQQAEAKAATQSEEFNASLEASLKAQRDVLDKATDDAVNAEKSRAFEDHQGLSNKVADLQRALDDKTAEELGEGAEIDLYEDLRKEFPADDIQRVAKGTPGADILHVVMLNGKKCGTIIYDSKNHKQFRWEHVTKLRADQLAAQAEHAILSTGKFPQGARQLHLHDGVLLANPARVVLIATIVRQHLLQLHAQRVSDVEWDSKTAALYEFIISERCGSLLSRIEERTDDLLEQQKKEIRWHENHWKKEGEALRGIQKAKADLESQIHLIIGTKDAQA